MSRYGESPTETWSVEVATEHGFPYTFPFEFDRELPRNVVEQTEAWGSTIAEAGRFGETSTETFTTPVSQTGRYGANP